MMTGSYSQHGSLRQGSNVIPISPNNSSDFLESVMSLPNNQNIIEEMLKQFPL